MQENALHEIKFCIFLISVSVVIYLVWCVWHTFREWMGGVEPPKQNKKMNIPYISQQLSYSLDRSKFTYCQLETELAMFLKQVQRQELPWFYPSECPFDLGLFGIYVIRQVPSPLILNFREVVLNDDTKDLDSSHHIQLFVIILQTAASVSYVKRDVGEKCRVGPEKMLLFSNNPKNSMICEYDGVCDPKIMITLVEMRSGII